MSQDISVKEIIDHAFRRCGVTTPTMTPEQIQMAKNNLMFSLLDLNNRGVPIYLVEQMLLGFTPNTWEYTLPREVYDLTNVNWRQVSKIPVIATGGVDPEFINDTDWLTYGETTDNFTLTAAQENWFDGYGLCFVGDNNLSFVIETSLDGITWQLIKEYPLSLYTDGQWIWDDMELAVLGIAMRVRITSSGSIMRLRSFQCTNVNSGYEVVASRMNRDDFFSLPTKGITGSPWNYYFQKTLDPKLFTWQSPTPSSCFSWVYSLYYIKAPIQDSTSLPARLQVPQWYVDAIIWTLAAKMAWELPNPDSAKINMIESKALFALNQAEAANADMGPVNLIGNVISQYQRLK